MEITDKTDISVFDEGLQNFIRLVDEFNKEQERLYKEAIERENEKVEL